MLINFWKTAFGVRLFAVTALVIRCETESFLSSNKLEPTLGFSSVIVRGANHPLVIRVKCAPTSLFWPREALEASFPLPPSLPGMLFDNIKASII